MSHLSTIIERIKKALQTYNENPNDLLNDPHVRQHFANLKEVQVNFSKDCTADEIIAANDLFARYVGDMTFDELKQWKMELR